MQLSGVYLFEGDMTPSEIREILKSIRYPHYEFFVNEDMGRMYLQARHPGGPPGGLQHTRKWYVSMHACKNEIVQTALKLVLTSVEHEAREMFTYRGKKIFGPHFDVDMLVEICINKNLDYRRTK